jgi:2'-5' RNA ligase
VSRPVPGEPDAVFARARAAFLAESATLRSEAVDFPDWHLLRPRFALWAIDVDLPAMRAIIRQSARALEGLLLEGWGRQPHVTLCLCGFPASSNRAAADWGRGELKRCLARLAEGGRGPFSLRIGGLSSFTSAPFLEVRDPERRLSGLRETLGRHPQDLPDGEYVPHVTLGLYGGAWPCAGVAARLSALPPAPVLDFRVVRLSLMSYECDQVSGPLTLHGEWDLCRGAWTEFRGELFGDPRPITS